MGVLITNRLVLAAKRRLPLPPFSSLSSSTITKICLSRCPRPLLQETSLARRKSTAIDIDRIPREQLFPLSSSSSLGLENSVIIPDLSTLCQLPEVEAALRFAVPQDLSSTFIFSADSANMLEGLQRGADIFVNMPNNSPYQAVLALQADRQTRTGRFRAASRTLQLLQDQILQQQAQRQDTAIMVPLLDVTLARSKVLLLLGDTVATDELCQEILQDLERLDDSGKHFAAYYASARTGQACARLCRAATLDDAFSVRDPFRMTVKYLENNHMPARMVAAAYLNMGIAEAVYAGIVSRESKLPDRSVPLDGAMRSWKQGLIALKKVPKSEKKTITTLALKARLQSNMAWGLLNMSNSPSPGDVQEASEFCSRALKVYDSDEWPTTVLKEGLSKTLTLTATCYHKTGKAVTAEGLLQSACTNAEHFLTLHQQDRLPPSSSTTADFDLPEVSSSLAGSDDVSMSPFLLLEWQAAFSEYADLCRDWERRDTDAMRLSQQADRIRMALPPHWPDDNGKASVLSSLWFWTPSTLGTESKNNKSNTA